MILPLAIEGLGAGEPATGLLRQDGRDLFPIGFYELPKSDIELKKLAEAGVNLVHCRNRADLDRVHAAGIQGWISLPLHTTAEGREALRSAARAVADHPALAVWEGPDEVVWNFTAFSGLYRNGTYESPDEWWRQTPRAIQFSEAQADKIIPALVEGCKLVAGLDRGKHPIWINEAAQSDMKFVRQYLDEIQITGCDTYPIHDTAQKPRAVGDYTERFVRIGRGKPVWMVLQGFSWQQLQPPRDRTLRYPTFAESRFMAYDALVHGAKGILYWGTEFVPQDAPFRESLLALTSELAMLQPFLTAKNVSGVGAQCLDANDRAETAGRGIRCVARQASGEWVVILVNQDNQFHMGAEVEGVDAWEGSTLKLLYGDERAVVKHGGFVTRLKPLEVKVFASSPSREHTPRTGRDF
ncbi:MAG: hypothetical protein HY735_20670 [Verrucomicrobia bacterium]|nr:hypothetical protein [Verrucomicrobiota bacterium]